ncbi:MAG: hypothetical protein ACREQ5_00990 [Candidatus Dormibacteria bacterium]
MDKLETKIILTVDVVGTEEPKVTGYGTATYSREVKDWTPVDSQDLLIRVRAVKQVNPHELELVVLDVTQPGPSYVGLTEYNEWEGETWSFYIPLADNLAALQQLAATLDSEGDESAYELDMTPIAGSMVDVLVGHGNYDGGYMATHNKLSGRLVITAEQLETINGEGNVLHKGGIRDLMKEDEG